jgi:integrase/recombinase XerD
MSAPVITIFVRHGATCKHAGKAFHKGCDCPKHFRWYANGKQHFKAADTRTWAEAERGKRNLEGQLSGEVSTQKEAVTIRAAKDVFIQSREVQGISRGVIGKYRNELDRFITFAEKHGVFSFPITLPLLIKYRATWAALYPSTFTQASVQKRLRAFLNFCKESEYQANVPKMEPVQITEPPTMPLTESEYKRLLAVIPGEFNGSGARVRAVIQLMRWSGLAVRDAVTLKSGQLLQGTKGSYSILGKRQKTGVHVFVPIPPDVAKEILAAKECGEYFFWDSKKCTAETAAQKMSLLISRAFDAAKIVSEGNMVSHRLRDTFAVDLLTKGVPLEDVSRLLGHDSIVTTEKHYSKWVKGRQDRLTNLVTATWNTAE